MSVGVSVRVVTEERRGDVPLFVHAEWAARWPWLVQGMSGREAAWPMVLASAAAAS